MDDPLERYCQTHPGLRPAIRAFAQYTTVRSGVEAANAKVFAFFEADFFSEDPEVDERPAMEASEVFATKVKQANADPSRLVANLIPYMGLEG